MKVHIQFKIHLFNSFAYNGLFILWDFVFIVDKYVILYFTMFYTASKDFYLNFCQVEPSFNMLGLYSNVPYPLLWPLCHQLLKLDKCYLSVDGTIFDIFIGVIRQTLKIKVGNPPVANRWVILLYLHQFSI